MKKKEKGGKGFAMIRGGGSLKKHHGLAVGLFQRAWDVFEIPHRKEKNVKTGAFFRLDQRKNKTTGHPMTAGGREGQRVKKSPPQKAAIKKKKRGEENGGQMTRGKGKRDGMTKLYCWMGGGKTWGGERKALGNRRKGSFPFPRRPKEDRPFVVHLQGEKKKRREVPKGGKKEGKGDESLSPCRRREGKVLTGIKNPPRRGEKKKEEKMKGGGKREKEWGEKVSLKRYPLAGREGGETAEPLAFRSVSGKKREGKRGDQRTLLGGRGGNRKLFRERRKGIVTKRESKKSVLPS